MPRAILIHCWGGEPETRWYPAVRRELESRGFGVAVPAMPDNNSPKLSTWLPKLQELAGDPDEDLYLIGHSSGCITILRYLESLPEGAKIGGAILVAGFVDSLNGVADIEDELENFFETPIPFEKIKERANHFVAIHSDNDPFIDLYHGREFEDKLDAKLIVKSGQGHFSDSEDGGETVTELPEVVEEITQMQNN